MMLGEIRKNGNTEVVEYIYVLFGKGGQRLSLKIECECNKEIHHKIYIICTAYKVNTKQPSVT